MSYEKFTDYELAGILRNHEVCTRPINRKQLREAAADRIDSLVLKLGGTQELLEQFKFQRKSDIERIKSMETRLSTAVNLLERVKKDLLDRGSMDTGDHVVVVNLSSTLWNSLCDFLVETPSLNPVPEDAKQLLRDAWWVINRSLGWIGATTYDHLGEAAKDWLKKAEAFGVIPPESE